MKALVSAYACEPGKGSEPGAGWNIVQHLAKHHELWVITRANNRSAIEAAMARHPNPNLHFVYHDLARLLWLKRRLPGAVYPYHYLWQTSLLGLARSLHREVGFDVAHHLTLGSFRYPTSLRRLGIPLVHGPVGGAEEAPFAFWGGFGLRGGIRESLRVASNRFASFDPLVRSTYRSAAITLAVSPETARRVAGFGRPAGPVQVLPLIGVSPELIDQVRHNGGATRSPGEIKALFVGRLVHWKGVHLAIEAVAKARRGADVRLTVLGTGPFERKLIGLAKRLGVGDAVQFRRSVPTLADVYRLYREHDVFLFPSLHESGGMALLEAMAAGLPALVVDRGGPGLSVTEAAGIKASGTTPGAAIADLAEGLLRLAHDADLRSSMGLAAQDRVRSSHYLWDMKARELSGIYESAAADFDGRR